MVRSRILVVEDEAVVAKDLQQQLKGLGYHKSLVAATGEEAVHKAREFNPDLVLMDIVLSGEIDGIEAAHRIHSRALTPIIYLTAYSDRDTMERAKLTEPFGYLLKPVREKELQSTIEMTLYKYGVEAKLREDQEELIRNRHYLLKLIDDLTKNNKQLQNEIERCKRDADGNSSHLQEIEIMNRELKDFVHKVSHDLKVPLNVIITLSDWLSVDYSDKMDENGREDLNLLVKSAHLMNSLVDGLLEYVRIGRINEGKVKPERQPDRGNT